MKLTLYVLLFLPISIFAQDMNKCIIDSSSNKTMLIGQTTPEAFKDTAFAWWFNSEFDNYTIDSSALSFIEKDFSKIEVTVVMGTWCSDSRREVPRLLKILSNLDFPLTKLTIINVDRKKDDHAGKVKNLEIEKVPTIIVTKDGYEMGRIIETPKESLEKDLVNYFNREI